MNNIRADSRESFCLPVFASDDPTLLAGVYNREFHTTLLEPGLNERPPQTDEQQDSPTGRTAAALHTEAAEKERGANAGRSSCSNKVQGRGQRSEITGLNLLAKRGTREDPSEKDYAATKLLLAIYI